MIKSSKNNKLTIQIDGPNGNAFVLLGLASRLSKQMGLNRNEILNEMRNGDYNNLLIVFDKHFGEVCDLETNNEEYLKLFLKK